MPGECFHVLLPVADPIGTGRGTRGRWGWVLADVEPQSCTMRDASRNEIRAARWTRVQDLVGESVPTQVRGPIVCKVNGSPLIVLGDLAEGRAGEFDDQSSGSLMSVQPNPVQPLAISDYDLMHFVLAYSMASASSASTHEGELPGWLNLQTKAADRFWLALGLDIEQWNHRMQLFVSVMRAGANEGMAAVSERFEPDDSGLLDILGVTRVTGQLRDLIKPLQRYRTDTLPAEKGSYQ